MKNTKLNISRKLFSALAGASLLLTTGCLQIKGPSAEIEQIDETARTALVEALDQQSSQLIKGINQVIITGNFVKNIAVENPPQPIPIDDNNEVSKAIGYLLSYADAREGVIDYYPDSRICSDIIAKNDPRSCTKVMEKVLLTQIPSHNGSGVLEVRINGSKLVTLSYSPNSVSLFASVSDVVGALTQVSQIIVQDGGEDFANKLPSTHEGAIQLEVSHQLSVSTVKAHILAALDIRGQNENGDDYSIQVQPSQNTLSISLDSALGVAQASISLPQVQALFTANDEQNLKHQVQAQFPGATGSLNLENSISTMALQALKLSASEAYISVDGSLAASLNFADQIDAEVQSAQGGHVMINVLSAATTQLEILSNPLITKTGSVTASVAQGTQVYVPYQATQAKVLAGSIELLGTLDFDGSMNAQANTCVEHQQDAPLFLQTSDCQF